MYDLDACLATGPPCLMWPETTQKTRRPRNEHHSLQQVPPPEPAPRLGFRRNDGMVRECRPVNHPISGGNHPVQYVADKAIAADDAEHKAKAESRKVAKLEETWLSCLNNKASISGKYVFIGEHAPLHKETSNDRQQRTAPSRTKLAIQICLFQLPECCQQSVSLTRTKGREMF